VDGRAKASQSIEYLIRTVGEAKWLNFKAEKRAMSLLKDLINPTQYEQYLLTGCFGEVSTKSRLFYLFRRSRPTIVVTFRGPDGREMDQESRFLVTLCAHPLGFYEASYLGALVPTDEVIAHLLLMRADEHLLWKKSNQHSDPVIL
jgi:hypothetical protein